MNNVNVIPSRIRMKNIKKKVYPHLVKPEKYPWFYDRHVKVLTRKVLNNEIQFTILRAFTIDEQNRIINMENDIKVYVDKFKLGRVLWPVYTTLLAGNFRDYVNMVAEKDLYIFDIWGYVPGCRPTKDIIWGEYSPPEENVEYMKEKLGDRFLGFDNGEQDGRYVGGFSHQHLPLGDNRKDQYKNFHKHFEKLGNAMKNYMVTLASLTFLHYFAKEGNTIILGAETAQALPNNNMWFSYIRGAAKQYGLLYFGNASVWNRWGYKTYESKGKKSEYEWGPECGTSLSLLRRLMYSHYMYNCDILGFESSWLQGDNTGKRITNQDDKIESCPDSCSLTPVGQIQQYAIEFVREHDKPGVMYAPLALLSDFFSGWMPPRHLYSSDVYKVWGNLPYDMRDYQLDLIFSILYPGYEDSGFYRDERGFLTPTPHGEIADVLFSDTSSEVLTQYNTLLVLSGTELTYELFDKIRDFVKNGGHAVFFGDTVKKYKDELSKYTKGYSEFFGLKTIGETTENHNVSIDLTGQKYKATTLQLLSCELNENASSTAVLHDGAPVIVENTVSTGGVSTILADCGIDKTKGQFNKSNQTNAKLTRPYELLDFVKDYLKDVFDHLGIIRPDNLNLQYNLCIKNEREYTLLIANNTFEVQDFDICSNISEIQSVNELQIEDNVKDSIGYWPNGIKADERKHRKNTDKQYSIDGGDVRIFKVKLTDVDVEFKKEKTPAGRGRNLYLKKPEMMDSIKDTVLLYPEFIQHFSGIQVSAQYLEKADISFCRSEAEYLKRQKVDILVDFTPLLNHYPDLSLIKNLPDTHRETIRRITNIIKKASAYNGKGLIFTLHKNAECNLSVSEATWRVTEALSEIESIASEYDMAVLVQNRDSFISNSELADMINSKIPNIKLAYNTSNGICAEEAVDIFDNRGKLTGYLISAPYEDKFGQMYNTNLPVWNSKWSKDMKKLFSHAVSNRAEFIVLSASYTDINDVYADIKFLKG